MFMLIFFYVWVLYIVYKIFTDEVSIYQFVSNKYNNSSRKLKIFSKKEMTVQFK